MPKIDEIPNARAMKKKGFTNHIEGSWYYTKSVGTNTTFNLTIEKATGVYDTCVLNELFGQPEYYMNMVDVYRNQIVANIEVILYQLSQTGLEIEFDHNEYGGRNNGELSN